MTPRLWATQSINITTNISHCFNFDQNNSPCGATSSIRVEPVCKTYKRTQTPVIATSYTLPLAYSIETLKKLKFHEISEKPISHGPNCSQHPRISPYLLIWQIKYEKISLKMRFLAYFVKYFHHIWLYSLPQRWQRISHALRTTSNNTLGTTCSPV